MPEQLQLPLLWRYWGVRPCQVCGREHTQVNSPICSQCRYRASKHRCPISGCHRFIAHGSMTCLWHRSLQALKARPVHVQCGECGAAMTPGPMPACSTCQQQTYHLCTCRCGRYRRTFDAEGRIRLFV